MVINTRFSPGSLVWTRIDGLPAQVEIGEIDIHINSPGDVEITYITTASDYRHLTESEVAATKQELFTL